MSRVTGRYCIEQMLGLEGAVDGKVHPELEMTLYVKIKDLASLEEAHEIEKHEQWGLNCTAEGAKVRIRAINDRAFILTSKTKIVNSAASNEVEQDISKDMFVSLRQFGREGYFKTRYSFRVPGTKYKWEVDVFKNNGGTDSQWVKIDFEMDDPEMEIPHLPFAVEEGTLIIAEDPEITMEQKNQIRYLWDKEWQKIGD